MRAQERSLQLTQVNEWQDGSVRSVQDSLAAEEPLEIRISGTPVTVTMRTPGNDRELAAGFLLTEGLIHSLGEIANIQSANGGNGSANNSIDVELMGLEFDGASLQRNFFAASSCGICGKTSIEAIRRRDLPPLQRASGSIPRYCADFRKRCGTSKRYSHVPGDCMQRPFSTRKVRCSRSEKTLAGTTQWIR